MRCSVTEPTAAQVESDKGAAEVVVEDEEELWKGYLALLISNLVAPSWHSIRFAANKLPCQTLQSLQGWLPLVSLGMVPSLLAGLHIYII